MRFGSEGDSQSASLSDDFTHWWWMAAAAAVALFAAYISLVPFRFVAPPQGVSFVELLRDQLEIAVRSRSNLAANCLLFVPFGLFGMAALVDERHRVRRWLWAATLLLVASLALSVAIEVAQIFVPGRTPSLADLFAQTVGTLIGIGMWAVLAREIRGLVRTYSSGNRGIVEVALLIYAMGQAVLLLHPFDLTVELADVARKVRAAAVWNPLAATMFGLEYLPIRVSDFMRAVPIGVLAMIGGTPARSRRTALGGTVLGAAYVAFVLAAQLFVRSHSLDTTAVLVSGIGVLVGIAAAIVATPRPGRRTDSPAAPVLLWIALGCAAMLYAAYHLSPFNFHFSRELVLSRLGGLSGMPFRAYYQNTEFGAVTEVFVKIALALPFGMLLRLQARRMGYASSRLGTLGWLIICGVFFSAVEIGQLFLPSRYPDNTDILLATIAAWIGLHLGGALAGPVPQPATPSVRSRRAMEVMTASTWRMRALVLLIAVLTMAASFHVLLRLPGVPYNVSNLLVDGGSPLALLAFSAAILWMGAGPSWLATWYPAGRFMPVRFVVGVVAVSLVSFLLLSWSVTHESLDDILGTSNVYWLVTNRDLWGERWRDIFLAVDVQGWVTLLERNVRYMALHSPWVVILALCLTPSVPAGRRISSRALRIAAMAVATLAWLWLCRQIVVTWAATDNLTELIATQGPAGLDGSLFLFGVLVCLAANVALIVRLPVSRRPWLAVACTLLAVPVGWVLLTIGLDSSVEKYGLVFSGAQFLLGQDREHTLGTTALLLRWAVVQIGAVIVMSLGAWLAQGRLNRKRMTDALVP